jgi:hypothetical protein
VKQPVHKTNKFYHLAIYGVDMVLIDSYSSKSLRESVRLAGLYAADMDNYSRVYREITRQPAAYACSFQLLPTATKKGVQQPKKPLGCLVLLLSVASTGLDFTFPPILGGKSV